MWPPIRNGSIACSSSARPQSAPMPLGPHILCAGDRDEVGAERLHVDRHVRRGLRGVADEDRALLVRPRGELLDRVDRAERVRDEVRRDDLDVAAARRSRRASRDRARPARRAGSSASSAPVLPAMYCHGHEVRVVLELGDDDEVAGAEVRQPPRVRDEVDRLGRVADEDDLARVGRVERRRAPSRARPRAPPSRARRARRRRDARSRTTSRRTPSSRRASGAASASSRRSRGRRAACRGSPARRSGSPRAARARRASRESSGHDPMVKAVAGRTARSDSLRLLRRRDACRRPWAGCRRRAVRTSPRSLLRHARPSVRRPHAPGVSSSMLRPFPSRRSITA